MLSALQPPLIPTGSPGCSPASEPVQGAETLALLV